MRVGGCASSRQGQNIWFPQIRARAEQKHVLAFGSSSLGCCPRRLIGKGGLQAGRCQGLPAVLPPGPGMWEICSPIPLPCTPKPFPGWGCPQGFLLHPQSRVGDVPWEPRACEEAGRPMARAWGATGHCTDPQGHPRALGGHPDTVLEGKPRGTPQILTQRPRGGEQGRKATAVKSPARG